MTTSEFLPALKAQSARILVVDDELPNRRLLEALLLPSGHDVIVAASGEEALEVISAAGASRDVDLVLLDVLMPGIGGLETCRRIREMRTSVELPVIFVTALTDRDARVQGKAVGADDYLSKPLDEEELRVRVSNLLRVRAYHQTVTHQASALERALVEARTQLRRAERLAALAAMSSGIGHQLGRLTADLQGTAEAVRRLARTGLPPELALAVALDTFIETLRLHTRTLQDIAVHEEENGTETEAPIELRGAIAHVVAMMRRAGRLAGVTVEVDSPTSGHCALASRRGLEHVLMSLLNNAVEALEARGEGDRLIQVTARLDAGRGRLALAVTDSGPGVPEALRDRIFDPYFTTRAAEGAAGLGLTVTRRLVEGWGGSIEVERAGEGGARFLFDLPLA